MTGQSAGRTGGTEMDNAERHINDLLFLSKIPYVAFEPMRSHCQFTEQPEKHDHA